MGDYRESFDELKRWLAWGPRAYWSVTWIGMVAEVTFENGKCGADNFRFVRHNAGYETIFCRPADETEVLGDLAARSKTRGTTLTANGDRVRVAP